jgi:serine/threonine protein kinase
MAHTTTIDILKENLEGLLRDRLENTTFYTSAATHHASTRELLVLAYLGRGSFGQVRLVKYSCNTSLYNRRLFALKSISKGAMASKSRERGTHSSLLYSSSS